MGRATYILVGSILTIDFFLPKYIYFFWWILEVEPIRKKKLRVKSILLKSCDNPICILFYISRIFQVLDLFLNSQLSFSLLFVTSLSHRESETLAWD